MPSTFNPGGGSSISNAGGTVSIDGAGAVHVTPADGQNTNIGGGALAITAPIEDPDTAVFKAVAGHTFYTGAIGFEVLVASIDDTGLNGVNIGDTTPGTGAFTGLSASGDVGFGTVAPTHTNGYSTVSIGGSSGGQLTFQHGTTDVGYIYGATALTIGGFDDVIFATGGESVERLRMTSGGGIIITGGLALRNGTNGQTLNISRTFTDASNYSQIAIDVTGSTVAFRADEAGTGVGTLTGYSFDQPVALPSIVISGTTYYPHDTAGTLTWTTTP